MGSSRILGGALALAVLGLARPAAARAAIADVYAAAVRAFSLGAGTPSQN